MHQEIYTTFGLLRLYTSLKSTLEHFRCTYQAFFLGG